jgi:uncharacterized OsmC-like protein
MRNGLNVGGASEVAHEICANPAEAILRYRVRAERDGRIGVAARTMRAGTIRVARDFRMPLAAPGDGGGSVPDPVDYLLSSLGGCVMFTWVEGCTIRGITIQKLRIRVEARLEETGRVEAGRGPALRDVRYDVAIECDGASEQIADIAGKVTCFSPNHRTFVEGTDAHVRLVTSPGSGPRSRPARPAEPPLEGYGRDRFSVDLEWRYGAHFDVRLGASDGSTAPALEVDQPKQLAGLDRAPNPQEYMLAALSGELLAAAPIAAPGLPIVAVEAAADIDMRGFFNTGQTDVVKVHNVVQDVLLAATADADGEAQLARCLARSVTHQTLTTPTPVDVTVSSGGERVVELRSDAESVRRIMDGVTRMVTFQT